jgi:lipopolysaccharide export system protein LptC
VRTRSPTRPNGQKSMNRPMTARTDPQTARAYWIMGRADSARAFHAARRHSRWVRILRIALPAAVAVAVVVVFLLTYFNPLRMLAKLPINIGDLVVSGTKITMERPHLSGFTRDARAYELSADAAAQDLTKPDIVELHNIHGKVEMQNKSTLSMSAVLGIYDSKGETLKLERNIDLSSSTGYAGHLSEALIDIRKGHVVSNKPVQVKLLQGKLDANRLEIVNSGEVVRFDGGVRMTVKLDEAAAGEAGKTASAPGGSAAQ